MEVCGNTCGEGVQRSVCSQGFILDFFLEGEALKL